ncbi:unnamed protein product [Aphanomyces euteiches]
MDALEKLLETHQVDDSTADKMCYDAFVCLLRESSMVQSKLRMFPAPSSMFYLDGQPGTFHTLPNGEACGLDQSAVVGEYKAWMDFGTVQLWYAQKTLENSKVECSVVGSIAGPKRAAATTALLSCVWWFLRVLSMPVC